MAAHHPSLKVRQRQVQRHVLRLQAVGQHIKAQLVALADGIHQHGRKGTARVILHGLPVAVIIDGRPRHHGPVVVQLPGQAAHAVRTIAAVRHHAPAHAVALQHQPHVHQVFKLLRHRIIQAHGFLNQGIPYRALLMRIHYGRLQLIILGRSKGADGLHLRKGLKAVLAHETRYLLI